MLYLVATPIGNLGDITLRALETLRNVDVVVSEDTRKTGLLLKHFEIRKPQISFHEYNEERVLPKVLELLWEGKSIAVVTNAGSPAISDPGYLLVKHAVDNGYEVTAIPGANAVIPSLILSGLPVHSFTFRGFPPRKSAGRQKYFSIDRGSANTLIYYESPYRLAAFLKDALQVFGDRQASVANDLTKMFEKVSRGFLSQLIEEFSKNEPRGEYTVVIAGVQREGKSKKGSYEPEDDDMVH